MLKERPPHIWTVKCGPSTFASHLLMHWGDKAPGVRKSQELMFGLTNCSEGMRLLVVCSIWSLRLQCCRREDGCLCRLGGTRFFFFLTSLWWIMKWATSSSPPCTHSTFCLWTWHGGASFDSVMSGSSFVITVRRRMCESLGTQSYFPCASPSYLPH